MVKGLGECKWTLEKIEQDEIPSKSCGKRKKRFVHISNIAISFIEPPSPGKEDGKGFLNMYFSCTCSIDGYPSKDVLVLLYFYRCISRDAFL